jgi:hypothetical protein
MALFSSKSVPKFSGYLSKISLEIRLILFIPQNVEYEAKFIFIENIGGRVNLAITLTICEHI